MPMPVIAVNKPLLLGLTGGIGSGKSTVAELFRAHGALVLSADQVSRELLEPEAPGWLALAEAFGERYFTTAGRLYRVAFREAIFADPALRARVDQLLHPLIRQRLQVLIAGADQAVWPSPRQNPAFKGIVVEVPLLFESGWQEDFPCLVVVASDEEQALSRLLARDGVSRAQAMAALAAQLPLAEKVTRADLVIDNRGELVATAAQVARVIERLNAGDFCRRV